MADNPHAVRTPAHMGDRELGEQKRRAQHEPLHQVVFLHRKIFDGVDVLQAGDVGHELDRSQFGGVGHGLGNFFVLAQVRFDEDHLATHVAGHFLSFLAFLLVDIKPDRHESVGSRRNRSGPPDSGSGSGDDAYVLGLEMLVFQNQDLLAFDFRLSDVHERISSFPSGNGRTNGAIRCERCSIRSGDGYQEQILGHNRVKTIESH